MHMAEVRMGGMHVLHGHGCLNLVACGAGSVDAPRK